jgi:hypothetical protein
MRKSSRRISLPSSDLVGSLEEGGSLVIRYVCSLCDARTSRAPWSLEDETSDHFHEWKRVPSKRDGGSAQILEAMREDDISHDPYGTCMGWHFAIADLLSDVAPDEIPSAWDYRRGLGGSDEEDWHYVELSSFLEAGIITTADLVRVGNICSRYVRILHMQDRSY